jgi:hypothetical protein
LSRDSGRAPSVGMKLSEQAPAMAGTAGKPGSTSRSKAKAKAVSPDVTTTPAEPGKRSRSPRRRPTRAEPGRKSTAESTTRSRKARVAAAPPPTDTRGVEIAAARLALRQAQLEALGIDDPGEGPIALRERWTFVPGAPSDPTSRYDGQSCDQCGLPISSDTPSCPRCGYRPSGTNGAEGTAPPETSRRAQPPKTIG